MSLRYTDVIRNAKTTAVSMGEVRSVRFKDNPYLVTYGLDGCFCVTMIASEAAMMAHVAPSQIDGQMERLKQEFRQNKDMKTVSVNVTFFTGRRGIIGSSGNLQSIVERAKSEIRRHLNQLALEEVEFREIPYPAHSYLVAHQPQWGTVMVDGSNWKKFTHVYLEDQRILVIKKGKVYERTPSLSPSPPAASRRSPSADPRLQVMRAERERSTSSERARLQLEPPRFDPRRSPSPDPRFRPTQQAQQPRSPSADRVRRQYEPPRPDPRQPPPRPQDVKGKGREDKSRSRSPRDEEEKKTQRSYRKRS